VDYYIKDEENSPINILTCSLKWTGRPVEGMDLSRLKTVVLEVVPLDELLQLLQRCAAHRVRFDIAMLGCWLKGDIAEKTPRAIFLDPDDHAPRLLLSLGAAVLQLPSTALEQPTTRAMA
jgi:hypothetical protein